MSDYLSTYGAGEAQRASSIKKWILIVLAAVVAAGLLALLLRNFSEKRQVSAFLDHLRQQDYRAAYAQFGCTDAQPCRDYSLAKFMEDWGPQSSHKDYSQAGTEAIRSCKTGLIEGLTFPSGEMVPLVVQRDTKTIGFAPYPFSDQTRVSQRSFVEKLRWWLGDLLYSC